MIRSNQTLLKLSVDLDPKNEQGGIAIAGAMRINTTITDLNLGAPGAPWPMDASTRAEVDNTLRINKFLRGVDSDANASSAASMAATATRFPPAAPAVAAAAAAASQNAPIFAKETAASVLSSVPAVPTPSSTPAGPTAPQSLQSQPVSHSSSTGGATSFGEGADSPGSMLELLRRKLDAFQGTESSSMRASAPAELSVPSSAASAAGALAQLAPAPVPTQNPPASAPAPQPSLAEAVGFVGSTAMAEASVTNDSVLTPSPATTGIMVSADELQQLHERVRASHRLLRVFTKASCICLGRLVACCPTLRHSR